MGMKKRPTNQVRYHKTQNPNFAPRKRIRYAQNFITNKKLVSSLVQESNITASDLVIEVGPGEGIITEELSRIAGKVIAVEIDEEFYEMLLHKFANKQNIQVIREDFLEFRLPSQSYKVFANIPFNLTADIIRKLLESRLPPDDAYLVVQEEAAAKFCGYPSASQFSILLQPWFEFSVQRKLNPQDFFPRPAVTPVFFEIHRRSQPLVAQKDRGLYEAFVKYGFQAWKKDLKNAYRGIFSYEKWKGLSRELQFSIKATPSQLNFPQWLGLFNVFLTLPPDRQSGIYK